MLKTIVGDWGSELDDGDYACALAALGVLESSGTHQHRRSSDTAELVRALQIEFYFGERTPIWRSAQGYDLPTIDYWRQTVHEDAAALATAWREYRRQIYHERLRPRLGITLNWRNHSELFDFNELYAWLNHKDVGLDALVLADGGVRRFAGAWHWPLRVGIPPGTEEWVLSALQTARSQRDWVEFLSRCYPVGVSRDSCDLMILTSAAAEELLVQSRTRIRARFVLCFEDPPSGHFEIRNSYRELRDRVHAAGFALIGRLDDSHNLTEWFTAVLRDLSHDVPIHAAVCGAGRRILNRDPVTVGSPRVLDQCRVLALAKRLDLVTDNLLAYRGVDEPSLTPLDPPDTSFPEPEGAGAEPKFGGPPRPSPPPPSPPRKRLADELRERMFTSEVVDGKSAANDLSQREDEIERTRSPRWIQANAWRPDAPERRAPSLAPSQWNLLTVHIGPTEQQRFDAPFPEHYVDFSSGDVAVTVQLEIHGTDLIPVRYFGIADVISHKTERESLMERLRWEQPATEGTEDSALPVAVASSEISLPQAGDSSLAVFAVRPHERVPKVKGRIAIIHNNRILQTAKISITADDAPEKGSGLNLVADAPIHPRYDDLEERREYDVAILVSDIGGKLHLTIQHNGTVVPVQLDDLGSPISDLRKALEAAAINWDHSKSVLEQVTFPDNLYTLAASGSSLEQHLRKKCGDKVNDWDRIHLVPATNEFLPLEYVYDGPAPTADARVCPNILGALEHESCDKALETPTGPTACPNQRDHSFVCPMHFWGFRKLIERSGTIQPAPAPGATQPEPVLVPSKKPYGKPRGMLFAASNRAFFYEDELKKRADARKKLVEALGKVATISDAADWAAWRLEVAKNPNLLVLIVHSQQYRGAPALEIGDQRFLGKQEISKDLSLAAGQPQLLILLGCSVASVSENFQPYPEKFRDAGVSIVLAPIATIRGADAVPIAEHITQVIASRLAKPEPTAFGELLPLLRRELLRKGHPGVMGIVGFGDGDWLLGGE